MTPKLRVLLGAVLLTVPLDQATKLWIDGRLSVGERLPIVGDLFYLTHVRNPGAAFGVFSDAHPTARLAFFIAVSLATIALCLHFFRALAPGDRLSSLALGLVLGGACGNLVDRLARGEVLDFLHVQLWGGRAWPDFNLSDAFIVAGVALLVLELVASEGESRAESKASSVATPRGRGAGDSPSDRRG